MRCSRSPGRKTGIQPSPSPSSRATSALVSVWTVTFAPRKGGNKYSRRVINDKLARWSIWSGTQSAAFGLVDFLLNEARCQSGVLLPGLLRSPDYRSPLCLHIHVVDVLIRVRSDDTADAHEEPRRPSQQRYLLRSKSSEAQTQTSRLIRPCTAPVSS